MLVVYDMLGRQISTLVNEEQAPGSYEVRFDGNGLASGMYIYRLTTGSFTQTRQMILLKKADVVLVELSKGPAKNFTGAPIGCVTGKAHTVAGQEKSLL